MTEWQSKLSDWVLAACLADVHFDKPGNVSVRHSFNDASAQDFIDSGTAIAPVFARSGQQSVGRIILDAVTATHQAVGHNTNLGIILLLAPLASVPCELTTHAGIEDILKKLSVSDAIETYKAISLAAPGGIGKQSDQDIASAPTQDLLQCMKLAAHRDLIAAQYANGYRDVFAGVRWLQETEDWAQHHEHRLAWLALRLMSEFGDSLIARKCGEAVSQDVRMRAQAVLQSGWPFQQDSWTAFKNFDQFLRTDGHRRNPGTTADIIAAILFVAMREDLVRFGADTTELTFTEQNS